MADKIQKIREEVEEIARSINPFIPDEDGKNSEYEVGRLAMATQILQIIDSLQEEPSKFDAAIQEGDDVRYNEDLGCRVNLSQLKRVAKKEEPVRRTSADIESAMQEVEEKSKAFTEAHKGESSYEILAEMRGEETASENLEEFALQYAGHHAPYDSCWQEVEDAVKAGAKWQEKQDQSIIELAEDHAMFAGMEKMKEQMMANAGNGRVDSVSNRQTRAHITVVFDSPRDIEVLDRLKVIVIKED